MAELTIGRDKHSVPVWTRNAPDSADVSKFILPASVVLTVTVPADRYTAIFRYAPGSNVYVAINEVPTVPVVGVVNTGGGEGNPTAYNVQPGDILQFLSIAKTDVTVAFYSTNAAIL